MGILGLTHDENGSALEKLPVTIKVAIGEGPAPDDENGSPRALFHFVFKRRTMRGQTVCWEPAPDIAQVFGDKPTELAVIFLHDDPREVCPSDTPCGRGRGAYVTESLCRSPTATRLTTKCRRSEGQQSTRRGSPGRVITNMWMGR